jgi:hypothetical protein
MKSAQAEHGALMQVARLLSRATDESEQLAIVTQRLIISRRFRTEFERLKYIEMLIGYASDPTDFVYQCERCAIRVRH